MTYNQVAGTPGCSWQCVKCVTARRPATRSTCSAGILYEYRVADRHRARADSNMHCSIYDDAANLAHSRYADKNYDSALNSSLRHVTKCQWLLT